MKDNRLIILTGPTAVGKTDLSIALAKQINGAIISADSMQVYRGMDIGSAKITREEMQGVPHYLIDILDPNESFDVAKFKSNANAACEEIYEHGMIPIVTGGTGFYIQALLYDVDFKEHSLNQAYREELMSIAKEQGAHALHEMLAAVDPDAAAQIHENNIKRTIRALEYFKETNNQISEHNEAAHQKPSPFCFAYFVLTNERKIIYEQIDKRVDKMMKEGLLAEVASLKEKGFKKTDVAMQGLGYKELLAYLDDEISLEDAIYRIKRDTRHFAKRQLTWFRRERDVIWIDKSVIGNETEALLSEICNHLKEKGILSNE